MFLKKTQAQKAGLYNVLLFKVVLPKKKNFALYFQHDCRYRIAMPLSLNDTGLLYILY